MSSESRQIETQTPPSAENTFVLPLYLRFLFIMTGVLLPGLCVVLAMMGEKAKDAPWQSGRIADYVAMLLTWPGLMPFLPLILFCAGCLSAYCFRPSLIRSPIIIAGILGGCVLAVQYYVFVCLTTSFLSTAAALFMGPLLACAAYGVCQLASVVKRFTIRHLLALTTVCSFFAAFLHATNSWHELGAIIESLKSLLLGCAVAAPTLNAITYVRVSYLVLKQRPTPVNRTLVAAAISWGIAWIAGWKYGVDAMMREYSKLPTTNPSCYVSSAAAYGHRKLVRSKIHPMGRVNLQMQRLKFLEFTLAVAAPSIHASIRVFYNSLGPKLASGCSGNVWFADATFLMLKPLEWVALAMRITLGISQSAIRQIYG